MRSRLSGLPVISHIGVMLAALLIGLYISRLGVSLPVGMLVFVPILLIITKNRKLSIACMVGMGLIIGLVRGGQLFNQIDKYKDLYGERVVVTGIVEDDTGYDRRKQTEFHLKSVTIDDKRMPGRIRVRGFGANDVSRGDRVRASGNLNSTLGTSRQGSLSFAEITLLGKDDSWSSKLRAKFFASTYSVLPEPQASFGLGFLVGSRSNLPEEFSDQLSLTGLTHIVAVSGYNLTIIVQLVKRLFDKKSAYLTVFSSLLLIAGFLLMTGWSPSIMRASIIAGLSLLAWYYGRTFNPLVLILLGAAITGMINPLYVWGDAGWYLSFLAFAGILIVAPMISTVVKKRRHKEPSLLTKTLIETLSAQLITLPFIAFLFGGISLIAPLSNLLVVPLIPLAMLLVFAAGTAGMVSIILGLWVALPARVIMTWMVWLIERLAMIPGAKIDLQLSALRMIIIYLILMAAIYSGWRYLGRKKESTNIIRWDLL